MQKKDKKEKEIDEKSDSFVSEKGCEKKVFQNYKSQKIQEY